jgi:hypothetical protein
MAKLPNISHDEDLVKRIELFEKKIESKMHFKSKVGNDLMTFDWVNEIDFACPYIDNIIRKPRLSLISEEDIVQIEKARKISVASVKDLSIHTHYIEKIDEDTHDVKPSQILIERNEETYNIYENRFVYTLIDNLSKFMMKKEAELEDFETQSDKVLEYMATTITDSEKINIELKVSANELPKDESANDLLKEITTIKGRIKRIKDYMSGWQKSEFINQLEKAHASFVTSPIRKTNVILKNPNFQFAMKLWNYLRSYEAKEEDNAKEGIETEGNDNLKSILDTSFLADYLVLDSIVSSKKEQKEKLSKYAVVMITKQMQRAISLLLNCGIDISEKELLSMISVEIEHEKDRIAVGSTDVKKKFENAMDEYLERTQDYL